MVNLMGDPTAVIVECRRVRRRFLNELGTTGTAFTFPFEFDALVALKSSKLAWRQLLLMERSLGNRRLDTVNEDFSPEEAWRALHLYGPLLYLDGRYAEARRMMEVGLNCWLDGSLPRYRNLFIYVGNADQPPQVRQRVTLLHVYQALGESLASWPYWSEFVRSVPIEVLRNEAVSRKELLEDPTQTARLRSRSPSDA
ncbi:hypothetical protein [Piscinibacter sp. HJYY11]|uniref:hypothetical protein n=1 Tax=Piscinibacter sp. HJYY11 TaxID=2801333 RepID=UPI00191FB2A8|nr:hypothetical protein [Piscinibacter sp. HJYY11]MBL0731214.1 hypothetical protein [Piscinibacter sp. HJYY11]